MTVDRDLTCRFEVHPGDSGALADVEREIREVAQAEGMIAVDLRRVERPAVLMVRLKGEASAIATVRERAGLRGRVLSDAIMKTDRTPGRPPYPDDRVSARIAPGHRTGSPPRLGLISGPEITVAIVDSGMMVDHPELAGHLWTGASSIHGARCLGGPIDHDVRDGDGHGTMLAGTVLAAAGGQGVRLMAVKFWDAANLPRAANAVEAITFASAHGAAIILLSWDLGLGSEDLRRAIVAAGDTGALVVIAAGNNGHDNDRIPSVPSCYASERRNRTITVMATDRYDEKATFSNYGRTSVDLAAPGMGIVSTHPFSSKGGADLLRRYRVYQGTSAAAAHVAGAAALLMYRNPSKDPNDMKVEDIKTRLVESVDLRPGLMCVSRGRLNVERASAVAPGVATRGV